MCQCQTCFREATGKAGTKAQLMAIGRALAKEYRERHAGREPDATERMIDGTTRYVNAYNPQKDPWTLDFVRGKIQTMQH